MKTNVDFYLKRQLKDNIGKVLDVRVHGTAYWKTSYATFLEAEKGFDNLNWPVYVKF